MQRTTRLAAKFAAAVLLMSSATIGTSAFAQRVPINRGPLLPNPNLPRTTVMSTGVNQWIQCTVPGTYAWWNPAWPTPYNTAASAQAVCNTNYGGVSTVQSAPGVNGPSTTNSAGQYNPATVYPNTLAGTAPSYTLSLIPPAITIDASISNAVAPSFPPVAATYNSGQVVKCGTAQNNGVNALNLNTGTASWSVRAPNTASPVPAVASGDMSWTTSVITSANWIGASTDGGGGYVFTTDFILPSGSNATAVSVSGKYLADNKAYVFIDGVPVSSSQGQSMYGFLPASLTSFYYPLPVTNPGTHKIIILVHNIDGPSGLKAEITVRRTCPLS